MTDVPGKNPGEFGRREYEIQILVPNKHRAGERWVPTGAPYSELAKAEWAVDDLVSSMMAGGFSLSYVAAWRRTHVRVMEKNTTVVYGKQMALPGS